MIKPSVELQELRRRIYRKAKAEKQWRFVMKQKGRPGMPMSNPSLTMLALDFSVSMIRSSPEFGVRDAVD